MNPSTDMLAAIIVLLVFIGGIAFCLIPASMAKKRGRSGFGWFLCSLFLTPIVAIFIVACLGDTEEKRRERIYEEEEIRRQIRNSVD